MNKLSSQKKPHSCPQLAAGRAKRLLIHRGPLKILTSGFVPSSRALVSNRVIPQGSGQGDITTPTPEPGGGLAPGVEVKWGESAQKYPEEDTASSRDLVGWD